VATDENIFVAVGYNYSGPYFKAVVLISYNGREWSTVDHTLIEDGGNYHVTWVGDRFIIGKGLHSYSYTEQSNIESVGRRYVTFVVDAIAWNGETLIIVGTRYGDVGDSIAISTDKGANWVYSSYRGEPNPSDVIWTGEEWVMVGSAGIHHSSNGLDWEQRSTGHCSCVASNVDRRYHFVIPPTMMVRAEPETIDSPAARWSHYGTTWTRASHHPPLSGPIRWIQFVHNHWFISGDGFIQYSADGKVFKSVPGIDGVTLLPKVTYSESARLWIMYNVDPTRPILWTADIKDFNSATFGPTMNNTMNNTTTTPVASVEHIAWGDGMCSGVANDGTEILYSSNGGLNWFQGDFQGDDVTDAKMVKVAHDGDDWVGISGGTDGRVYYSTDGISYNGYALNDNSIDDIRDIHWNGKQWLLLAYVNGTGLVMVTGRGGGRMASGWDLATWGEDPNSPIISETATIQWIDPLWVLSGVSTSVGSYDGLTWFGMGTSILNSTVMDTNDGLVGVSTDPSTDFDDFQTDSVDFVTTSGISAKVHVTSFQSQKIVSENSQWGYGSE
jgi:hypothetical protein